MDLYTWYLYNKKQLNSIFLLIVEIDMITDSILTGEGTLVENTTSMSSVSWRIFLGRKLQINGVGRVIFGQEMFNPVPAKVMGGSTVD